LSAPDEVARAILRWDEHRRSVALTPVAAAPAAVEVAV